MHKIAAFLILLALPARGACPDSPMGYGYCLPIPVDNTKVSGSLDLTNFVGWVDQTDNAMRTVANGGNMVDGADIRFQIGSTALDYELISYTATTGQVQAWVRIPTLLYATDTAVYLYFGKTSAIGEANAAGTWVDYGMVLHLDEGAWSTNANYYRDSTGNGNHGTGVGTGSMSTTGALATAIDFDGSDSITVSDSATLEPGAGPYSIQAWGRGDEYGGQYRSFITKGDWSSGHIELWHHFQNHWFFTTKENYINDESSARSLNDSTLGVWRNIAGTWPGTGNPAKIYRDGALTSAESTSTVWTTAVIDDAQSWTIGARVASQYWIGGVDEVRIRKSQLSGDWLLTENANYTSPSTFFVKGFVDTVGGAPAAGPKFRVQDIIGLLFWRSAWLLDYWQ